MSKTLLEQLPEIVRAGKRQAERIMEGLEGRSRVGLQTRELVTPAKDTNWQEFQSLKPHAKANTTLGGEFALLNETPGQTQLVADRSQWFNRLIYGDNLLCMAALLAGDAELRDGFEQFDFAVPFILREQDEEFAGMELDIMTLADFSVMTFDQLKAHIGKGDVFRSQDVQTGTQFGDYRVEGGIMTATGYNDFLGRLVRRISESLSAPVTKSSQVFANISRFPFLQVNLPELSAWVDDYIRRRLFARQVDPFEDENWRLLCLDPVANHIIKEFGRKLPELAEVETTAPPEIKQRRLSEVVKINVRESSSIHTPKCIYERLPYPSRNGGFELAFMQKANGDASVEAFCKINEQKHIFMRLRYVKENGLPGFYSSDFLVRTPAGIWLVETKAQDQLAQVDVVRKKIAAVAWCERVNELDAADRAGRTWAYCLLGEAVFYEFRDKGATMEEMLQFSRVRAKAAETGGLFA